MKIGLVSSVVPFVAGGGRFIYEWLSRKLDEAGHQVETITLPFVDDPNTILKQIAAFRLVNLDACDRVITFRPPAYVVRHHHKIVWFIHHFRTLYDLWDTPYCNVPHTPAGDSLRAAIYGADMTSLSEAKKIFTNSQVVSDRLKKFNGINGTVVYPPIEYPERFICKEWGDEIVMVCRISAHKRQHLAIEAMKWVKTPVRLRICGNGIEPGYLAQLQKQRSREKVQERVTLDIRWISESEKAALLSTCLAAVYLAYDEDSYGYSTLEAAHARKPTIGLTDGGGISEFIIDDVNGILVRPEPKAIADAFDRLWSDRTLTRRLGEAAYSRVDELGITWDNVFRAMLS